jgi:hypothetical protein
MNPPLSALIVNLCEAKSELERLITEVNCANVDEEKIMQRYHEIFKHLSLAWNGRQMTLDELSSLDNKQFDQIGCKLPPLGARFHF